jgi:hypothetical protein
MPQRARHRVRSPRLFLLASCLARGVARVAGGLALGLEFGFAGGSVRLLTRELFGGEPCGFGLAGCFFGLGKIAQPLGLGAGGGLCRAFRLPLLDGWIVGSGLRADLVLDVLLGLQRRLLTIGKAGFFESTHR